MQQLGFCSVREDRGCTAGRNRPCHLEPLRRQGSPRGHVLSLWCLDTDARGWLPAVLPLDIRSSAAPVNTLELAPTTPEMV